MRNSQTENINNNFFKGYYKEIWKHIFPEKTTQAEIDFIVDDSKLFPGSHILDLMSGYGRHSLGLARKGMNVTAVDNLTEYIAEITENAKLEDLKIESFCADVLEMKFNKQFDAVICMGNSLQFFNEEDSLQLLSNIATHLKDRGRFYVNTWSIAEIAMKNIKEKSWSRIGDTFLLSDCRILFQPTRMEINSIMIKDTGEREEKTGIDYIYSIAELEAMLNKTGFILKEIYSIPGKKQFTVGEPRAYIVAEKNPS